VPFWEPKMTLPWSTIGEDSLALGRLRYHSIVPSEASSAQIRPLPPPGRLSTVA